MSTISRRSIALGAAWAVPVIAVGQAAPAMAASGHCDPNLVVVPEESSKCCNGKVKNMKVTVKVTDTNGCGSAPGAEVFTILSAQLDNSGTANDIQIVDNTIYLLDTSNCTVNLLCTFLLNGQTYTRAVTSNNIPSGNTDGDCTP